MLIGFITVPVTKTQSQTIIIDAIKEAARRVIRAIDLKIQRLQNATIELQNIQKQVENALSKLKLEEIADWTEKHKEQYRKYFDELWRVKTIIAYYKRITEVIEKEKQLVLEYKRAYALIRKDQHFTEAEIDYIHGVYAGILNKSVETLDQMLELLQSFAFQMSDAQRLVLLNKAADQIETCVSDLRRFNDRNTSISLQRAKSLQDIEEIKKLYGIQ